MCHTKTPQSKNAFTILKFGGSSVARVAHWKTIKEQVSLAINQGYRPILVLSALKNVSNALEALLHQSKAGVHTNALQQIKELHLGFSAQLGLNLTEELESLFKQLSEHCESIYQSQQISPMEHANVLSFGEMLSTKIGFAYLKKQGINTLWKDARTILTSKQDEDSWHHFTSAECAFESNTKLKHSIGQAFDDGIELIITQGFIASDAAGNTVLLGREGSDTSAAYIGAQLNAKMVEIWTDVPGVYTANPKEVPNATAIESLPYFMAHTMSNLGAKVLHPRAIKPAEWHQIPIRVKSTLQPEKKGTLIGGTLSTTRHVKTLASESKVTSFEFSRVLENDEVLRQSLQDYKKEIRQLGFDIILESDIDNNKRSQAHVLIATYNNSDIAPPSSESLKGLFLAITGNLPPPDIRQNVGLISYISPVENNENQGHSKDLALNGIGLIFDKIIGSVYIKAFICDAADRIKLFNELHHRLIEG